MIKTLKSLLGLKDKKPKINFNNFIEINGFKVILVKDSEDARRKIKRESIMSKKMVTADVDWLPNGTGLLKIRKRKTAL